jgi:hypothetical protein
MSLEHLPSEQLAALLHQAKWITEQLTDITPNPEFQELFDSVEKQATLLHDTLLLEQIRRALVNLQAQMGENISHER